MIYENSHARNLANFDSLLARIFHLGNYYNPVRNSIRMDALTVVSHNARMAIANVTHLHEQYTASVNHRERAFETLKKINRRIAEELKSLTGIRETEMYMLTGCGKGSYDPFTDQHRYDFLLDNFSRIIRQLKVQAHYSPLQKELQIPELEERYASLRDLHQDVKKGHALLCNAMAIRDEVLYRDGNGLVSLASLVKRYIKYHFGWNSLLYKEVAGIYIRKEK